MEMLAVCCRACCILVITLKCFMLGAQQVNLSGGAIQASNPDLESEVTCHHQSEGENCGLATISMY